MGLVQLVVCTFKRIVHLIVHSVYIQLCGVYIHSHSAVPMSRELVDNIILGDFEVKLSRPLQLLFYTVAAAVDCIKRSVR